MTNQTKNERKAEVFAAVIKGDDLTLLKDTVALIWVAYTLLKIVVNSFIAKFSLAMLVVATITTNILPQIAEYGYGKFILLSIIVFFGFLAIEKIFNIIFEMGLTDKDGE